MEYQKLFERLNHTELFQIARRAGHNVFPNLAREALIQIIISEEQVQAPLNDIDATRFAIMRFIIDHRKKLETQISCPAKSFKEDACFTCVDAQVLSCFINNGANNQRLIQLHKKNL
jgi:hypothetical protein